MQRRGWEINRGKIPWNKDKKTSLETRKKQSESAKKRKIRPPKFTRPRTESEKKRISKALKKRGHKPPIQYGKNCWNWKNGRSNDAQFYNRARRNRKFQAIGSHTKGEWELLKKQYGYACPSCKELEPKIKLTEDHIIPLTKGGSDYIENIQPLCKQCNSKKYNKIIPKYEIS